MVRMVDDLLDVSRVRQGRIALQREVVDVASDRGGGGLGPGLALVRSIVGLHGGSVAAHSAGSGRGSEFVVRLPPLPGTCVTDPGRWRCWSASSRRSRCSTSVCR